MSGWKTCSTNTRSRSIPSEPVICLDEQPYQLLDDTRPSQWPAPGKAAKQDYEYRRCGTCSMFVAVEPRAGKRFVQARRQRTRTDFARFVRDLLRRYPKARRIHLVLDNLNTHNSEVVARNVRPEASAAAAEAYRVAPHAQACQLAEHGGNRNLRAHQAMS